MSVETWLPDCTSSAYVSACVLNIGKGLRKLRDRVYIGVSVVAWLLDRTHPLHICSTFVLSVSSGEKVMLLSWNWV